MPLSSTSPILSYLLLLSCNLPVMDLPSYVFFVSFSFRNVESSSESQYDFDLLRFGFQEKKVLAFNKYLT